MMGGDPSPLVTTPSKIAFWHEIDKKKIKRKMKIKIKKRIKSKSKIKIKSRGNPIPRPS